MRILLLSDRYPPYYEGGYEIECSLAAEGLEQRGHDVSVLTSMYGIPKPRTEGKVHRLLHTLYNNQGQGFSRRKNNFKNAYLGRKNYKTTLRIAKEVGPDIIFVWRMGHVSIFPVKAAYSFNAPVVCRLSDFWLMDYKVDYTMDPSLLKKLYRGVLFGGYNFDRLGFNNIISISEALKNEYVGKEFPSDSFTVIYPGIPRETVRDEKAWAFKKPDGEARLVFAGRLVEEKGVHVAVEALCYLVNTLKLTKLRLDIIGNGPGGYLRRLNEMIDSWDLRDNVRLQVQMPQQQLINSYKYYDAFLFTSIWEEPFGIAIIEAMSQGLPVIASRVGGVPEIIENGENGILVPPGDPIKLAKAIMRFIHNPALAKKFSLEGIRTVLERFTAERFLDQVEDYLYFVFGKGRGAALSEEEIRHEVRKIA